jgi:hypothetical protein
MPSLRRATRSSDELDRNARLLGCDNRVLCYFWRTCLALCFDKKLEHIVPTKNLLRQLEPNLILRYEQSGDLSNLQKTSVV